MNIILVTIMLGMLLSTLHRTGGDRDRADR